MIPVTTLGNVTAEKISRYMVIPCIRKRTMRICWKVAELKLAWDKIDAFRLIRSQQQVQILQEIIYNIFTKKQELSGAWVPGASLINMD